MGRDSIVGAAAFQESDEESDEPSSPPELPLQPFCHGAVKHLMFFSSQDKKLRHFRRLKVVAGLIRGTSSDMKSLQTKSQRTNLVRMYEFATALLDYNESPRDKLISVWIVDTLISYSYPIASFIGDDEMLQKFSKLSHQMLLMVLDLHEKLFKMFQSLAFIHELANFLLHIGLHRVPQMWKDKLDSTKILFRARQQLGQLLTMMKEQNPNVNLDQLTVPSYPFLSRFLSVMLTMEYLHGSPDLALLLLGDVINAVVEKRFEVKLVERFVKQRLKVCSGNIVKQIAEVSAVFWVFLRVPTINDLDVAHKSVLAWVLERSRDEGEGQYSLAPSLGAFNPVFVPAVTYLAKEALSALETVQTSSAMKYGILDRLICSMLDIPVVWDEEVYEQVTTTLALVIKERDKRVQPLDSNLKCSLACFWYGKKEFLQDENVKSELGDLMRSFLGTLTPVLDMTPSEVSCMNSMLGEGWKGDVHLIKSKMPWLGTCHARFRPYVIAIYTLERSNCRYAPLDFSQTVLRIALYEGTLKVLGISRLYGKLRVELETVFMYQIRKQAFNEGVSPMEGKLTKLICKSLVYLKDEKCSTAIGDWILDIVQKLFMDYGQLCWNRACSIQMMKLSSRKKKLYMWWFNRLITKLHPQVVIALLCTAFYSESDFAMGKSYVDKKELEEEMHLFRESLMKKVFESISLKGKGDKKIAHVVMQALSFDRVQLINQMKVVFSMDWPKTVEEFDKEVQKSLQAEGLTMTGIDLAIASLRLARPIMSELSNRVLKQSEKDYIYSPPNSAITKESTASIFGDHKPWNIDVSKVCSKKKEQTLFANIRRNWMTLLNKNSTTNNLDIYFFYGVCARMIRIFTGDIQAWKDRISNLHNIEDLLSSCIDFCLERHEKSVNSAEDIRRRIATVTLTWLYQNDTVKPRLCPGDFDRSEEEESTTWDKPYFEQATTVSENVEFLLAMKMLEMDYRHSQVWMKPTGQGNKQFALVDTSSFTVTTKLWKYYPQFADLGLRYYPFLDDHEEVLAKLIIENYNEPFVQANPDFAEMMLKYSELFPSEAPYHALDHWAPTSPRHFVEFFHLDHPCVERYILGSMEEASLDNTKFVIPQIIQCLRHQESVETVEKVLLSAASKDEVLAAYIYWQLKGEKTPPKEAFNPVIKRSGWKPPEDVGLWKVSDRLLSNFSAAVPAKTKEMVRYQVSYFDKVYEVATHLGSVSKESRVKELRSKLKELEDPVHPVYIPFYPDKFIDSIEYQSCITLASAAKIPILVFFNTTTAEGVKERIGCIFKVGDDCRQDVLALQIVSMLQTTFKEAGLKAYLYTYGVIVTDFECGLIEVIPNTKSRSGLGELSDCGLVQIFKQNFGSPGTDKFERARQNFIRSAAGYAVSSFILWAKDRHNGNIMIDKEGHLIHIDFGFIFGISPGGNLGFENAGFKLSHEMCQLIDPLGNRQSPEYKYFKNLCIRGFLAARRRSQDIIDCVSLMDQSGLPCFGYGKPIEFLKQRLAIHMHTNEAAAYFEGVVDDAYMKWTTGFYDLVQFLQQGIPK